MTEDWLDGGVPAALVALVKQFEGLAKIGTDGLIYPYLCPAGYATQGWGLRVESMEVPPITREEADRRLLAVLPMYVGRTLRLLPALAGDPAKLAAVADFTFNLGPTALSSSTFARRVRDGDWEAAAEECQRWVFGGGRKLPGLVRRRAAEARLILAP